MHLSIMYVSIKVHMITPVMSDILRQIRKCWKICPVKAEILKELMHTFQEAVMNWTKYSFTMRIREKKSVICGVS